MCVCIRTNKTCPNYTLTQIDIFLIFHHHHILANVVVVVVCMPIRHLFIFLDVHTYVCVLFPLKYKCPSHHIDTHHEHLPLTLSYTHIHTCIYDHGKKHVMSYWCENGKSLSIFYTHSQTHTHETRPGQTHGKRLKSNISSFFLFFFSFYSLNTHIEPDTNHLISSTESYILTDVNDYKNFSHISFYIHYTCKIKKNRNKNVK